MTCRCGRPAVYAPPLCAPCARKVIAAINLAVARLEARRPTLIAEPSLFDEGAA